MLRKIITLLFVFLFIACTKHHQSREQEEIALQLLGSLDHGRRSTDDGSLKVAKPTLARKETKEEEKDYDV